jgi:hypothetical protein
VHRLLVVALVVASSPALAERTHDGNSGRGRLGQVTSGIKDATDRRSSSSSSAPSRDDDRRSSYEPHDSSCCSSYDSGDSSISSPWTMPNIDLAVEGFAGAQKVFESGGSLAASFAVVAEKRVRLGARLAHYFENETSGDRVAMTLPNLTLGVRIGKLAPTQLWLDGGLAYVRTVDPEGSASLLGSVVTATLSHQLSPNTSVLASGGAMLFDGVQAYTARAGIRLHHVELAFSALDFSVGPPLYGPELGIGF